MSFPTVEIVHAAASEAVLRDPYNKKNVSAAFAILQAQDGMQKINYGLQREDKSTFHIFIAWEDLQAHQKLINNTEIYPVLTVEVKKVFAAPLKMYHVKTTSDPFKAFDAPILEVATFTLLEAQSKSTLDGLVSELTAYVKGGAAGVIDAAWGPIVENDNAIGLFIGWTSVEAHLDLVKTDTTMVSVISKIKEIATIELVHVPAHNYEN